MERPSPTLDLEAIRRAPKVLLHDHLDGGLRPRTVLELAPRSAIEELPTTDPDELSRWFTLGADRKSLELYLEGFRHTVAVMQTRDAIERVAAECAEDLAADGVVYAEVRMAPELLTDGDLSLDEAVTRHARRVPSRQRGPADHDGADRDRDAPGGEVGRDRRACGPPPRRWGGRLRHRRAGGRLPAHAPPRRVQPDRARELPLHDPRRRGVRAAVDLGGAPVVRRRAARPRRAHRGRHHGAAATAGWRSAGSLPTCAIGACRSRCARRPTCTPAPPPPSRSTRSICCAGSASGSPSTPTTG